MHDVPVHLYARGPYRVVDLRDDDRPRPYVVVDTAGAWLHEDASFDGARDWVDRRDVQRLAAPAPSAPRARGLR